MMQGKLAQHLFTFRGEGQQDLPAILTSALAAHIATSCKAIYQLDCTVMLDLQAFSQFSYTRTDCTRQAFQREHQLVLPWLQPCLSRGSFAEVEEAADLVAQLGQGLVIIQGEFRSHAANYIVPGLYHYIVYRPIWKQCFAGDNRPVFRLFPVPTLNEPMPNSIWHFSKRIPSRRSDLSKAPVQHEGRVRHTAHEIITCMCRVALLILFLLGGMAADDKLVRHDFTVASDPGIQLFVREVGIENAGPGRRSS